MILKKITLDNFRQFYGEQSLDLDIKDEKNVIVVMGENGSGKTTLAQAFRWCFYDDIDFSNENLVSQKKIDELKVGETVTVKVEIEFLHNNLIYVAKRTQKYYINGLNKVEKEKNKFILIEKKLDGQSKIYEDGKLDKGRMRNNASEKMKEILAIELSRYFFFDGERIEKMGEELSEGSSKEFPKAVVRLLGLEPMSAALLHLNGKVIDGTKSNRKNVIKTFTQSYDSRSDSRMSVKKNQKDQSEKKKENKLMELKAIESSLEEIDSEIGNIKFQLKENENSKELQEERERIQKNITDFKNNKEHNLDNMLRSFGSDASVLFDFLSIKMIEEVEEVLSNSNIKDKGIPGLNSKTIEFLFNRKECICGNKIEKDSLEFLTLKELLNYIPPKSIDIMIRDFSKTGKIKIAYGKDFFEQFDKEYKKYINADDAIDSLISDLEKKTEQLKTLKDTTKLQEKLEKYENEKKELEKRKGKLNIEIHDLEKIEKSAERELDELASRTDNNKKMLIYKEYAKATFDRLDERYSMLEMQTKNNLEESIDKTFNEIYDGGFSLKLDDKYNVEVISKENKQFRNIETSQAQTVSIIFAFIVGVMKLSKKITQENKSLQEENKSLQGELEPYPLVMDAPLSLFDKKRIKTVSKVIPEAAEQVIIFIKDTDGEYAEQHMKDNICRKYKLNKKNEYETYLEER